jgi:hypothetical protein
MGSTIYSVDPVKDGAILVSDVAVGYDMDHKQNEDANGLTRLPRGADERAAAFLADDWARAVA